MEISLPLRGESVVSTSLLPPQLPMLGTEDAPNRAPRFPKIANDFARSKKNPMAIAAILRVRGGRSCLTGGGGDKCFDGYTPTLEGTRRPASKVNSRTSRK
jgi:hypothetical protein